MATGFQPLAGVSGRVKSVIIPDNTDTDLVVVGAEVTVTGAEITGWDSDRKVASGKVVTLESPAYANTRVVATRRLRGGIEDATVRIRGLVNADETAAAASPLRLPVGAFIKADLVYHKTSTFGHYGVVLKIVNDNTKGAEASENPQTFDLTCEVDGTFPDPTFPP